MMRSAPDGMVRSAADDGTVVHGEFARVRLTLPQRMARATVPAAGVVVGLFFFVVTGINGFRGGRLWAILITTPAIMGVGWFGWGSHPARLPVTAVFAARSVHVPGGRPERRSLARRDGRDQGAFPASRR
jgi:hypothetical protein